MPPPWRLDRRRRFIAKAFRSTPTNPLLGLEGRAALLRALGNVVAGASRRCSRETTCRALAVFSIISPRKAENGTIGGTADPVRAAAAVRADLAVTAVASAACRSATAGGIRRWRPTTPPATRAAAQAVAMARLLADRAAAARRLHGDRHRRPDRARRIPQRRPVRGHRRARAARPGRRPRARTTCRLAAGRRMARAHRGAARSARAARLRAQSRHRRRGTAAGQDPAGRHLGGRAANSPSRGAPTAVRRSTSSATARCFDSQQRATPPGKHNHARRQRRRPSAGPAQAHAHPRQGPLDQVVPRACSRKSACCCATRSRATCR